MTNKTLIAIPAFNCEKQLYRVLTGLVGLPNDIVVVDNRSTDNTLQVAKGIQSTLLSKKLKVILNNENYGLGGSHKVIFDYALNEDYSFVCILHGDDQADTSEVSPIVKKANTENRNVLGSRFNSKSTRINYQLERVLGNEVLNIFFSLMTFRKVEDLGSGLNVFKMSDIAKIDYLKLSDNFNFNSELLLEFIQRKIEFSYTPITWREFDQVSNARNFKVATSMLKSLWMWRFEQGHQAVTKQYSYSLVGLQ